jgi:pimeloyl-ACP methyl ester carboxylesterase
MSSTPPPKHRWRRALRVLAAVLLAGVGGLLLLAYWPLPHPSLTDAPEPRPTFAQAVAALTAEARQTPQSIQPECRPELLHHGHPTAQVFVLLHGLSNCPAQFHAFGKLLYQRGANVVIPRLPYHGERDRMTEAWQALAARMMLDSANRAIDQARGLGERVTVIGISINGTVAAWLAQNRADVDEAVLLAPFLAPKGLPEALVLPAARLIHRLPNRFLWWDPKQKAQMGGHAYPRFPTHVIAEVMDLGDAVLEASKTAPPKCGSILVVTTAADKTASLPLVRRLVERWRRHRPEAVRVYEFPASQRFDHDFIDPESPTQQVAMVYPKLLELLFEDAKRGGRSRQRAPGQPAPAAAFSAIPVRTSRA